MKCGTCNDEDRIQRMSVNLKSLLYFSMALSVFIAITAADNMYKLDFIEAVIMSVYFQAIFGMSFFDYLNQYRIEHAKVLLSELSGQNGAVLNVAFTVGFNSNSAFYAAFKKCAGKTPAQYRRSQSKRAH